MSETFKVGQHWLEVAYERICSGEDETQVMNDYRYYYQKESKLTAYKTLCSDMGEWMEDVTTVDDDIDQHVETGIKKDNLLSRLKELKGEELISELDKPISEERFNEIYNESFKRPK